jgi:hypothetical protein
MSDSRQVGPTQKPAGITFAEWLVRRYQSATKRFLYRLEDAPRKSVRLMHGGYSENQYDVCNTYKAVFSNIIGAANMHGIKHTFDNLAKNTMIDISDEGKEDDNPNAF